MRIVVIVLAVGVLLFAAVFVIGGLMLNKGYAFERSIVIAAPPAAIHAMVGDFSRWGDWAPFREPDSTVTVMRGAKSTGVGASQTWVVEQGSTEFTFTQWDPQTGIEYDMAVVAKGNRLPTRGAIRYEPANGATRVTWSMHGSVDKAIVGGFIASTTEARFGPIFKRGLEKLKEQVEKTAASKPDGKPAVPAGTGG